MEDCKSLLSELKEEDKRLRLKRRWLMDLPLSERESKRIKELNPLSDGYIMTKSRILSEGVLLHIRLQRKMLYHQKDLLKFMNLSRMYHLYLII